MLKRAWSKIFVLPPKSLVASASIDGKMGDVTQLMKMVDCPIEDMADTGLVEVEGEA